MRPIVQEVQTPHSPESLASRLRGEKSVVLLQSALRDASPARYSFVTARPFLTFRSFGSLCETESSHSGAVQQQFGNPWQILDRLMARFELLEEIDMPFPLGGCFGYWGYDLKNFVEPKVSRRAINDLELPDCHVGFYDSLAVFDHQPGRTFIVSTGLDADGSRSESRAKERLEFWACLLEQRPEMRTGQGNAGGAGDAGLNKEQGWGNSQRDLTPPSPTLPPLVPRGEREKNAPAAAVSSRAQAGVESNFSKEKFLEAVEAAQRHIRAGDIYQVNLSQRFAARIPFSGWELYEALVAVSPAPFSAFLECDGVQIVSSSPEQFLRISGSQIVTRPIKGTRPRDADPTRDAQLTYELQTSPKEMAELVMITDLLRNDLGRVCQYGSVQVPELVRLERYPQVQHLVSTVEGRLRADMPHFAALAACFPGGSITGAPKIRAMQIIDELEPVSRGPYTGAIGYVGFNRESQLSIAIRTAICREGRAWYHAGAGIVADSNPQAEYEETLAKAGGFFAALQRPHLVKTTTTNQR